MYATQSSIWEILTWSSSESTYTCICMHITVLQSCKAQHGECMVPNAVLCGPCKYYVVYYQACDFLVQYCGQTACNTNCMMCTGTELALCRYVALQWTTYTHACICVHITVLYCTHSYNHAFVCTMHFV